MYVYIRTRTPCSQETGVYHPTQRSRQESTGSQKGWDSLSDISRSWHKLPAASGQLRNLYMVTCRAEYLEVQNGATIITFLMNHVMRVQPPLIKA